MSGIIDTVGSKSGLIPKNPNISVQLPNGGQIPSTGVTVETLTSPDGGAVPCNVIRDEHGTWIKVAIYSAPAYDGVKNATNSVTSLATTLDQSTGDNYSADWGNYYPTEVRVLGCTDFHNWQATRKVDFIYGVPVGRKWKNFFSNGLASGTGEAVASNKWGFATTYAKDGRGQWVNNDFVAMGMSDSNITLAEAGFTTATSSFINLHTGSDAKLLVSSTGTLARQDGVYSSGFGYDDSNVLTAHSERVQYSNANSGNALGTFAAWVMIKQN